MHVTNSYLAVILQINKDSLFYFCKQLLGNTIFLSQFLCQLHHLPIPVAPLSNISYITFPSVTSLCYISYITFLFYAYQFPISVISKLHHDIYQFNRHWLGDWWWVMENGKFFILGLVLKYQNSNDSYLNTLSGLVLDRMKVVKISQMIIMTLLLSMTLHFSR